MSADLDWFLFETKMRALVREILNPVLQKSEDEKERYLEIEKKTNDYLSRLELLEYSMYNNNGRKGPSQKAPTIFE